MIQSLNGHAGVPVLVLLIPIPRLGAMDEARRDVRIKPDVKSDAPVAKLDIAPGF